MVMVVMDHASGSPSSSFNRKHFLKAEMVAKMGYNWTPSQLDIFVCDTAASVMVIVMLLWDECCWS